MIDADKIPHPPAGVGETPPEVTVVQYARRNIVPMLLDQPTSKRKADAVRVVANEGRWIVECPSGDGGAQFASREDPRFMCVECANGDIGNKWRRVLWPDDVDEIEAVLDARPLLNRNYEAGQTVADLLAEEEQAREAERVQAEVERAAAVAERDEQREA